MDLAFFTSAAGSLVPTDIARSLWSGNQMHGVALGGALAREIESCAVESGAGDLRPARMTVDLFRAATMDPCRVTARVVRRGRRICLVDAELTQDDRAVARASAILLRATESPDGKVWSPDERPAPPTTDEVPVSQEPRPPYFFSADTGWSQQFGDHQDGSRKMSWNTAVPIVAGEEPTAFQAVASMADGASLVTNWGSGGVEFINTDITLTLARLPEGLEIGLAAVDRVEEAGIAAGVAAVFDRTGPLGNIMVTSLANARRAVDFEHVEFTDDGRRTSGGGPSADRAPEPA